jgi:hypothetical protein
MAWNERFQAVGGGGYAGSISWAALATAIRNGYVTASTDTGHNGAAQPGGSFALNPDGTLNAPSIEDFAFRPAELWPQIAMEQEAGGPVAACKLNTATNAAIAACDGFDGVMDGVLEDPRQCRFDPIVLQCPAGATPDCSCLTPKEVAALRKVWDGPRSEGKRLWYGLTRGTPLAALSGADPFAISADHFRYWLERDKTFDWHKLDYAAFEAGFQKPRALFNRVNQ